MVKRYIEKCFAARRKITAPTGCTCRKNKLILDLSNIVAPGAEDCLHALRSVACRAGDFIDSLMPHTRYAGGGQQTGEPEHKKNIT